MYQYRAKVIRVIDADTMEMDIDLGFHTVRREKVRILGYDAPEVRLYEGVTEDHKKLGLKAKKHATDLLFEKYVMVQTFYDKTGKYGRFLVSITMGGNRDYAMYMKQEGFVKEAVLSESEAVRALINDGPFDGEEIT